VDTSLEVPTGDALERRLNYLLTAINIVGAALAVGYLVVAIDEISGQALRRRWERLVEQLRSERRERDEYKAAAQRVQFEAWLALQEKESNDG
jgi:hypothetical protein